MQTILDIERFMPVKYNYASSDLGYKYESTIDELFGLSQACITAGFHTGFMAL